MDSGGDMDDIIILSIDDWMCAGYSTHCQVTIDCKYTVFSVQVFPRPCRR